VLYDSATSTTSSKSHLSASADCSKAMCALGRCAYVLGSMDIAISTGCWSTPKPFCAIAMDMCSQCVYVGRPGYAIAAAVTNCYCGCARFRVEELLRAAFSGWRSNSEYATL
jgi:hypothetical protein